MTTGRECIINTVPVVKLDYKFDYTDVVSKIVKCNKEKWDIVVVHSKAYFSTEAKDGNCILEVTDPKDGYKTTCRFSSENLKNFKENIKSIDDYFKEFERLNDIKVCETSPLAKQKTK